MTTALIPANGFPSSVHSSFPPRPLRNIKRILFFSSTWLITTYASSKFALRYLLRSAPENERFFFKKSYPCRPMLENRIFLPKADKLEASELMPLYINVHGGGFIMGSAQMDDAFCAKFANDNKICVVSIDYRKAPRYCFPVPVQDAAAIALSVIEDGSLPIDKSRVVVGGFSAGATIALAMVQTEELKGRVKGVVAFNPITDWSIPASEKVASVRKDESLTRRERRRQRDRIGSVFANLMRWAYIPNGQELTNPMLSPIYASRSKMPEHMFLIGAENDMMCAEAESMANALAGRESSDNIGDEVAWGKGGIRWEKVLGWKHDLFHNVDKGEREVERHAVMEGMAGRVAGWMKMEVFP